MNNFLIIGQGVAGSLLAWELLKRDKRVIIVDNNHKFSSSIISAGIINPIIGKRFSIADEFDLFFERALKTYQELKTQFDQTFFEELDILRIFQNKDERDHWQRKVASNVGQQYCKQNNSAGNFHPFLQDSLGSVIVERSGFCYTERLLSALKEYFDDQNMLVQQKFNYDDLVIEGNGVRYNGDRFDLIVFCEGYQAQWNPWFDWIPFNSVKGEILKIKMQGNELPHMIINKGKWCAPIGEQEWMAGSSYIWDHLDCEPTKDACAQIVNGLNQMFNRDIKVVDHKAGVRPVIDDQKVVLGRHPKIQSLAIFNGLGSKGFLTASTYAIHLAEYLSEQWALRYDLKVDRFYGKVK